jgi:hypothetical protein
VEITQARQVLGRGAEDRAIEWARIGPETAEAGRNTTETAEVFSAKETKNLA